MGDHTEAISIDYDPNVISYEQLLDFFWKSHRCERSNFSRQYRNAVFYRNQTQKTTAFASLRREATRLGIRPDDIETEIVPAKTFMYAEGYHQKYYLTQHREIRAFLEKTYPDAKSLADSTVATRLNAYLGSGLNKDWAAFDNELPGYGLPQKIKDHLLQTIEKKKKQETVLTF